MPTEAVSKKLRFWQTLLAAEVDVVKARLIAEECGPKGGYEPEAVYDHPLLTPAARKLINATSWQALEEAVQRGVHIWELSEYSETLSECEVYPGMFVDGDEGCLSKPTIGIVGTRNATTYGKACAQKFAEAFARAGVTVISGGALGIDGAAHEGALAGGGHTVAVLACGVDYAYPPVHRGLFDRIRRGGCLLSQFAVGQRPMDFKFLARNETIAAASQALLVIEAPTKSGALKTAVASAELGREVFVIPSTIDQASFRGSHNLVRDGATLVYHPDQVLESLNIRPVSAPVVAKPTTLGDKILAVLSVEPLAVELIVSKSGLETTDVLSELTMLELDGRVIRDSGGYAIKP